jgi:hypothetical protein
LTPNGVGLDKISVIDISRLPLRGRGSEITQYMRPSELHIEIEMFAFPLLDLASSKNACVDLVSKPE